MADFQEAHLHPTNAVEILGKVNEDLSVQLFTAIDFGSNMGTLRFWGNLLIVDFNIVDALVDISHQNREIFY